jgi:hypothetical protein
MIKKGQHRKKNSRCGLVRFFFFSARAGFAPLGAGVGWYLETFVGLFFNMCT